MRKRLWSHLYLDLADAFTAEAMPDLPGKVLDRLVADAPSACCRPRSPPTRATVSPASTSSRLADGERIETVLMRFTGRVTACISSQVGCAMGCVFCATGQMGYTRHLTPGEIVAQAVHVARTLRNSPLAPAPRLSPVSTTLRCGAAAQRRAHGHGGTAAQLRGGDAGDRHPARSAGLALAAERITVSTVGVVPGILRLAAEKRPLHLAVSLHAATRRSAPRWCRPRASGRWKNSWPRAGRTASRPAAASSTSGR
jgi:23S rRNA (adenine2503-C2)-methyltransferase